MVPRNSRQASGWLGMPLCVQTNKQTNKHNVTIIQTTCIFLDIFELFEAFFRLTKSECRPTQNLQIWWWGRLSTLNPGAASPKDLIEVILLANTNG